MKTLLVLFFLLLVILPLAAEEDLYTLHAEALLEKAEETLALYEGGINYLIEQFVKTLAGENHPVDYVNYTRQWAEWLLNQVKAAQIYVFTVKREMEATR